MMSKTVKKTRKNLSAILGIVFESMGYAKSGRSYIKVGASFLYIFNFQPSSYDGSVNYVRSYFSRILANDYGAYSLDRDGFDVIFSVNPEMESGKSCLLVTDGSQIDKDGWREALRSEVIATENRMREFDSLDLVVAEDGKSCRASITVMQKFRDEYFPS